MKKSFLLLMVLCCSALADNIFLSTTHIGLSPSASQVWTWDGSTGTWSNSASGGGSGQTPFTSDIDAGQFSITNLAAIQFGKANMWRIVTNLNNGFVVTNIGSGNSFTFNTDGSFFIATMNVIQANMTNLNIVSNLVVSGSLYAPTNTAPLFTNANSGFSIGTLYTNANQRDLLVGSFGVNSGVSGSANIVCLFTNSGIGYSIPCQAGSGISALDIIPFCIPLSPNATFQFVGTFGTGAGGFITNCVLWK